MEKKMDLRVQKTYLTLHYAFTELLEEKKFEEFTVNELCDRAMIRRTTFYKHFADKYDYFTFYLKETCESFQEELSPDILTEDINAYYIQMSIKLLRFISDHQKLVNHISESDMFHVLLNILSEHITTDLLLSSKKMPFSKDMDPLELESLASFYAGGLLNMLLYWIKQKHTIDEKLFIAIITDFTTEKMNLTPVCAKQ